MYGFFKNNFIRTVRPGSPKNLRLGRFEAITIPGLGAITTLSDELMEVVTYFESAIKPPITITSAKYVLVHTRLSVRVFLPELQHAAIFL